MQRVPMAEFEPGLARRLDEWWGRPPNLYRALANHPALVAAWADFAHAIRHQSRSPRTLRELMILRGAQLARSEYEWAQHLRMARAAGVREAQIAALAKWEESQEFDECERAAIRLAEAVTRGVVPDAVHAEATRLFGDAGFVELSLTAAFYAMVSRMLEALRVELEPEQRPYSPRLP